MYIISYFTQGGVPKTGLSPTLKIWRVSDAFPVIVAGSMSEIGGGFYRYNFSGYSPTIDYAIRCDGGDVLSNSERYSFAGNEGFHDDIYDIQQTVTAIETLVKRILGLSQENYRLFNTSYDISGMRLVGCTIKLYNNKGDCDADLNHFSRYTMSATYGQDGQLSDYKVVKEAT